MKNNYVFIGALALLAGSADVRGQSTVTAAGGSAIVGSNTYDWSVGELAWVSPTTAANLTQGLLQPKIFTASVSSPTFANQLQVFPNPASTSVNIQLTALKDGKLTYRLMDIAGRVIHTSSADVTKGIGLQQVDISKLAVATYMLHISFSAIGDAEETAAFRIQKLQ